jgi:soluble lytic murein transglycosylase
VAVFVAGTGFATIDQSYAQAPSAKPSDKAKPATKPKSKADAPPLPAPSPKRLASTPSPVETEDDGSQAKPAAKPTLAVPPAMPNSPEARYFAELDKLIAPLRDRQPSADDAKRLRDALKSVEERDMDEARAHAAKIADPSARTLIEWYALRSGIGAAADFTKFLATYPDWPDARQLSLRAEQQLLSGGGPAKEIIAFFGTKPPTSGAGSIALASAYLALGDEGRAKALAVKAWRENDISASAETGFLGRFEKFLNASDHRRRLDGLLVDEGRFAATRNPRVEAARRLVPKLAEPERKKVTARIAVYARSSQAAKLMAALPADAKEVPQDWGLLFQRIQLARSQGKEDEVARLLRGAPKDADSLVDPDAWWLHRRWVAYEYIGEGRYKDAYELVRDPGPLTVNPLKDATFLAGWIALRHLKNPKAALAHFEASNTAADGPLTAARALYWLGRAHEELGQKGEADRRYREAAARIDTFHGHLARHKLSDGHLDVPAPLPAMPSPAQAKAFNDNELLRAALLAHHADVGRGITRIIFAHLRYRLATEPEVALLAHLASALGDHQMAIRVGKTAVARNMNLFAYSYPVHPLPEYKPLRESPERAMLLAIARQESEFNPEIISHAGARGLLQVMPITARHICKDHKIKCDIPRLNTDSAYNAMIASAYIGDRKDEFSGSYVLTLAGYNAGPGRARQWMKQFGDPRKPGIDPIDWIETIPFEETREYVKKVLSNVQMYRARLGESRPVRLVSDLNR